MWVVVAIKDRGGRGLGGAAMPGGGGTGETSLPRPRCFGGDGAEQRRRLGEETEGKVLVCCCAACCVAGRR
jgi:hypothetical protein